MTPKFILASNSPRRREILSMLGIDFEVIVSECDESIMPGTRPKDAVTELARRKALAVLNQSDKACNDVIIIAADTVVSDKERILGKPMDKEDAFHTLMSLSDKAHSVWTGIALIGIADAKTKIVTDAVETKVVFGKLSEDEARFYVETGEPLDKAGSYGIQGIGGFFVTELHGDYYNVVGLPIAALRELLMREFGLNACDYIGRR